MFVQHRALDGGASDVKTYSHVAFPPKEQMPEAKPPVDGKINFFAKN